MSLLSEMISSGVHYGHKRRFWNPKMNKWIFAINHRLHIINLDKTLELLNNALSIIENIVMNNGIILFVGTKRQAQQLIKDEAIRCNMPYINNRWLGGTLTNYKTIRKSINKLRNLELLEKNDNFKNMIKKEYLNKLNQIKKLNKSLGGIKNISGLPDALFIIDSNYENIAVEEANKLGIKTIAVLDTNCNPDKIDCVIPGNDDSMKAIKFYLTHIVNTIITAKNLKMESKI